MRQSALGRPAPGAAGKPTALTPSCGELAPESLLDVQERYDTFFDASPAWQQARAR